MKNKILFILLLVLLIIYLLLTLELFSKIGLLIVIATLIVIYIVLKKKKEKARMEKINSHINEWGQDWCEYLIKNKVVYNNRLIEIMSHKHDWGTEIIGNILQSQIGLDMTEEMVILTLGKPTSIDNEEIMKSGKKERWVYGVPRQGAVYIFFKNGKVTKVKK